MIEWENEVYYSNWFDQNFNHNLDARRTICLWSQCDEEQNDEEDEF